MRDVQYYMHRYDTQTKNDHMQKIVKISRKIFAVSKKIDPIKARYTTVVCTTHYNAKILNTNINFVNFVLNFWSNIVENKFS